MLRRLLSSQSVRRLMRQSTAPRRIPDAAELDALIEALGSRDGVVRENAREALMEIGTPAARSLIAALQHPNDDVRWEAAKVLGELKDPSSAPALVSALEDRHFGVRWLAAEALIALERDALPPLLHALTQRSGSIWLRRGAHHVLHELSRRGFHDQVEPVLAALEGVEPAVEVPPAVWSALRQMDRMPRRRAG